VAVFDDEWSRREAEVKIAAVFEAAKTGHVQKVMDFDGTFEIKFTKAKTGPTVADILAEGNPLKRE